MARKKIFNLEFGNFICKFGEKLALMDLLDEIVIPAFTDKTLIRTYAETKYFLDGVEILKIVTKGKDPIVGIMGQFIKDTTLEREQIYKDGAGLIKDSRSMQSSPSAVFLLILNNHRLLYVKETKDAPDKEALGNTILNFLRNKHKKYIDTLYDKLETKYPLKKITKKSLLQEYPKPSLQIVPLTSKDNIKEFIRKYNLLKTIEIKFRERNDEHDNDPFFDQVQQRKDLLGSEITSIKHHSKGGLEKEKAIEEIEEATAYGNQFVSLVGTDSEGDRLAGNNEQFQIKKNIEPLTGNKAEDALNLYNSFKNLVNDGIINVPATKEKVKRKLIKVVDRYL